MNSMTFAAALCAAIALPCAASAHLVSGRSGSDVVNQHHAGSIIIKAQHSHGGANQQTAPANSQFRKGDIVIEAPWTRATPEGAKVAGGYITVVNAGSRPDRLIGGTFPLAGRFEVHEMAVTNGVMTMRELGKGLEIPAGGRVELKPGGFHVMLMDLKGAVKPGAPIKGTLIFERAGTVEIEYRVAPIGARGPDAHAH